MPSSAKEAELEAKLEALCERLDRHEHVCDLHKTDMAELRDTVNRSIAAAKPWLALAQTVLGGFTVALLVWLLLKK